jgi:hypothetical protein
MGSDDVEINLNVKNLTEGINKLTSAFADGMANISDRVADGSQKFQEGQKRQDTMNKNRDANLEKRYKLMANARVMETMTRSAGGGVVGTAMNFMSSMGQAKMSDMQRLQTLNKKGLGMDSSDIKERNMLASSGSIKALDSISKKFDKYFGGSSKWNKMFGGHGKMAATGIGLGAAAIGFQAVQKGVQLAIESSPLLQQMLKLWKFGIMMLLRPIATFFGMIMRPIMIVMLRKFIIPFYQKYMPAMMTLGDKIGKFLAGGLGDVFGWNGEEQQVLALTKTAALLVGGGIALKYLGVAPKTAIKFPLTIGGKIIQAPFKGFNLLVPNWLKKLLDIKVGTPATPTPPTPTTPKSSGTTSSTGSTFKQPPKISSSSKTPMGKFQQNQGSYNMKTGQTYSRAETAERLAAKQAEAVKYSTNTSKSDKLMNRVKDIFKRKGIVKGFNALKSLLPRMNFPKVKMDSLKNLLSMATAKGVFKGVLGGIAGGGASAGGLPWMIAENLDYLPPAKEFRLWFQGGMRQAAGMEDSEGTPTGKGGLDGRGIDSAMGNIDINNPISDAVKGGIDFIRNATGFADGGIINEPINGIGLNTGRKYKFGERGREAVSPLNKTGGQGLGGGTNITINIQSMSGSQNDLNNLKRTILNVIQESSIGRVRA